MPYPTPYYPQQVWDGLSGNFDRLSDNNHINPDSSDWERIAAEVISMQQTISGAGTLLPKVTESGPLVIEDEHGNPLPLTVSAVVLVDATSGDIVIDLPTAASFTGETLNIKKIDVSVNTVTLDPNASETIDDLLTIVIENQYTNITMVSDGVGWFIL